MRSLDVFTQEELEKALEDPGIIPVCSGDGEFAVGGEAVVRAADSARVTANGSAAVEAGGFATVAAHDRCDVRLGDVATVHAGDSVTVHAGGQARAWLRDSARAVTTGNATVDARDDSEVSAQALVTVRASDNSKVEALGRATVMAGGSSFVRARETSRVLASGQARVIAWGEATVRAGDSASVEAGETAIVVAGGSASVRAFGAAIVRVRGEATVVGAAGTSITRHGNRPRVSGEAVSEAPVVATAQEWCEYYGVDVEDGVATLYKAVDGDFNSYHGTSYTPGSEPEALDWDGGEQECGGGLHFSPRPWLALPHAYGAVRFVACPVRVEDIVIHQGAIYPDKVKARRVCGPVYEVDQTGRALFPDQ
jgi:hypothetical protein